ncbi:PLP-dependent cysteine synthase family protein [Thermoflexus hugenholtzii]|jgi:cysteine synthase (EC 2.5.1.47)|uniref:cysteine synthase n=1 Tax=Thermoflexus hugenholtzii JAD2 TaxID=877466 RepID=A0A212QNH0_9CHLR|nr:cysteine synthase family protein [Thermoflexus hugenholtzii]SNB60907.1 cysteine synthase [Thermoflexus hugenholtzii JAD2]
MVPTIARARVVEAKDLFELIGHTPLIRFRRITAPFAPVEIYAKAEWYNPGGSVKDRPAREIILTAEREGRLRPGKVILDATSGNMGIAYAMLGAARGYPVTLCIPANASPERLRILRAYGAELILTDPLEGTDGAILEARRRYEADPERYFYADQYNNPANWKAHYRTTGPEIWAQTEGRITHFVAGLGTSGTMMGVGRYLKEQNPEIRLIGVQPDGPFHGLEGLKHMETAIRPGIYEPELLDEILTVSTEEAYAMARRLAREEGLFVGISAGAAMAAALQVAARLREGVVVTLFPDAGYKYLSESFWFEADPPGGNR